MLCEIWEKIWTIGLGVKISESFESREEEANCVTYGGALFSKIEATLNLNYLAVWEQKTTKINVLRTAESILHIFTRNKKLGHCTPHMQ